MTPWTIVCQAPLSLEFSVLECWSRLPFPIPGDLPNSGITIFQFFTWTKNKWKEKLKSQWDPLFTHQIDHIKKFKDEQCWWVKFSQSCPTLWTYSPWNSLSQNTGVGSLSFLQGTFPTQGSNPGLSHCRQFLYQLSHKGSPRILEWVAYPFSSGSSWPRNWTRVSCIAGGFFEG